MHCDPTASHYLKIVLDGIFGAKQFRNEISWKRSSAHSDSKQGMQRCGRIRDVIFLYSKTDIYTWNTIYTPYSEYYLTNEYRHVDETGRRYKEADLTAAKPGGDTEYDWPVKRKIGSQDRWQADTVEAHKNPKPDYEYLMARPYNGRYWAYSKANLLEYLQNDKIVHRETGVPRLKLFADEMPGIPLQDSWDDISPASGDDALGFQTQKPRMLLERVISASSNPGDVVLDPFCGCGTAIDAAQTIKRKWIGIDVTHLAISLVEKRLRDRFPTVQFEVHGTPKDYEGAKDLAARDKYQFQWWACSVVNAQPYGGKKKGADGGVDGLIFFQDDLGIPKKIIVSVKGGENIGVTMVKDLIATISRQKAEIGLFVTLNAPTKPMVAEAAAAGFYKGPSGARFPRIQILQIECLLAGVQSARYPNLDAGSLTFKKAQVEHGEDTQVDLFGAPIGTKMRKMRKRR